MLFDLSRYIDNMSSIETLRIYNISLHKRLMINLTSQEISLPLESSISANTPSGSLPIHYVKRCAKCSSNLIYYLPQNDWQPCMTHFSFTYCRNMCYSFSQSANCSATQVVMKVVCGTHIKLQNNSYQRTIFPIIWASRIRNTSSLCCLVWYIPRLQPHKFVPYMCLSTESSFLHYVYFQESVHLTFILFLALFSEHILVRTSLPRCLLRNWCLSSATLPAAAIVTNVSVMSFSYICLGFPLLLSPATQSTQLYKWVPGCRQWWK